MASVTLSVSDGFRNQLKQFNWVNWSEIAKEETRKKVIFEKYLQTGEVSDDDWNFCELIDWHPVDELPLKKDFIKKNKKTREEKSIRFKSVSEIFR